MPNHIDRPASRDPRFEEIANEDTTVIQAAVQHALAEVRAAVRRPLPPKVEVDWAGTEQSVRLGLMIEHMFGDMQRRNRLLYELHVMREMSIYADRVHTQALDVAEQRDQQARRATLLGGVGPIPPGNRPQGR